MDLTARLRNRRGPGCAVPRPCEPGGGRSMTAHESFRHLMTRVRTGDPYAIRELFDAYAQPLLEEIRHRLRQPLRKRFDSQDCAQEVWRAFFAVQLQERSFDDPEQLLAFLKTIALRKLVGEYRQ